jgi:triosephosphate isomerase
VSYLLAGTPLRLGAQDVFWERAGAWTGEVSAAMLASAGCTHVLVGHSERRQHFAETDEHVARKVRAAVDAGLTAIACVGETLAEREAGRTLEVLFAQFDAGPGTLASADLDRLVLAYEPVWAIGTGRNATPAQAAEAHRALRGRARSRWGGAGGEIRILYGGSVKADNAAALFAEDELDGALVGGASLEAASFVPIVRAAAGG